mgnify:CR=1 FL=1
MKTYRIVGRPLTHDEMIEIAKSNEPRLYCIDYTQGKVVPLKPVCIAINTENKKWEFVFDELDYFDDCELIFTSERKAKLYYRRNSCE